MPIASYTLPTLDITWLIIIGGLLLVIWFVWKVHSNSEKLDELLTQKQRGTNDES